MFHIGTIVAAIFLFAPMTAFACGGYGDIDTSTWDVIAAEEQVDQIIGTKSLSNRTKRKARRVLERLQKRHRVFMKDGVMSMREMRKWDRLYARTARTLHRLAQKHVGARKRQAVKRAPQAS